MPPRTTPAFDQELSKPFLVGDWLVEPRANRIARAGEERRLEPKVMQVLLCLAEQPGQTVTRQDLLDRVWKDQVVLDYALSRTISQLRKAFDDDPRTPRVLETIPKAGYRLLLPVRSVPLGDGLPEERALEPAPAASGAEPYPALPPALPLPGAREAGGSPRGRWAATAVLLVLLLLGAAALAWRQRASRPAPPPELRPLTSDPGLETHPALSPDGRMLAFAWIRQVGEAPDLFVQLVGADQAMQLTAHPASDVHPAWSPDGQYLAFTRLEGETACGLYVVPVIGGAERKLMDCFMPAPPVAWSPDGAWLALTDRSAPGRGAGLFLVSPTTLERRPLTSAPPPNVHDYLPRFSPDGKHVAFLRGLRGIENDLYVVPTAGGTPRRLTADKATIGGMDWAPDGRHLLFSSNRTEAYKLWRIAADGGEPVWMSSIHASDPGGISAARQRPRFVYSQWKHDTNIWELAAPFDTVRAPTRLVASTRWDRHPQLSPDGSRIAFVSNRSGHLALWVCGAQGERPVQLTALRGGTPGMPRWSPDGRQLAFVVRPETHGDIYVIDAEGGPPRSVVATEADETSPSWSADGRWIYFSADRGDTRELRKVPVAGGQPVSVTPGGYAAAEAPAGEDGTPAYLYFTRYARAGLWRRPLAGGAEEQILAAPDPIVRSSWALTRDGIYFLELHAEGDVIAFYDFATGRTVPVSPRVPLLPAYEPALTASLDGSRVLFTQVDASESDIIMVELEDVE